MKKMIRKLQLNREEIQALSSKALATVGGGLRNLSDAGTCGPPSMRYSNCPVCYTEANCL